MEEVYNEINQIKYLQISNCQLIISGLPIEFLNLEKNKDKLCWTIDILYALKDKINNKLIIEFIFQIDNNQNIPSKISFYQNILLSFYTFMNIYFNQRQFILITFPQIFQNDNKNQLIYFDYQININVLTNKIILNNKEYCSSSDTKYLSNSKLILIFSQILSQIDQNKLLHNFNLFKYNFTCLAGTFDRCHLGHLFLIQSSLLLSQNHYFIGVCSDDMIKHKGPLSLIQPNFIRRKKIEEIINLNGYNGHNCKYEVGTIYDTVDMAGREKDLNCLIVTTETYKGGLYCNEIRRKNNLNDVDICTIDVININLDNINKISSSLIRKEILNMISLEKLNTLYEEFQNLFINLLNIENKNAIDYWWNEILEHYTKKWKYYHNLNHIYSFVNLFKQYINHIDKYKNEFLISIYFHDIIYIPSRNDNEEESIIVFNKFYTDTNPNNLNKEIVIEFIKETKHHLLSKNYSDELNLFMDMDMQIIADENWEDYENKIRLEFCFMNDTEYKKERKLFLQNLINKEKIFRTKIFYDTYEQKARNNINKIITKLN